MNAPGTACLCDPAAVGNVDPLCAVHGNRAPEPERVEPRCAHCRRERAECRAGVSSRELHAHGFSPTGMGNWFDCPLCETTPASRSS